MKNIFITFFDKKNLLYWYILFCWITSWTAIGVNPGHFFNSNFILFVLNLITTEKGSANIR